MEGSLRRLMANVLDCEIVLREFELQLSCIHFQTNTLGKGMNTLIPQPVQLLFFCKDNISIK